MFFCEDVCKWILLVLTIKSCYIKKKRAREEKLNFSLLFRCRQ